MKNHFFNRQLLRKGMLALVLLAVGVLGLGQSLGTYPYVKAIPNDTSTGTTQFTLTKLTSSGNAVIMATTDTTGYEGICVVNCGTSGTALIAFAGLVPVKMDATSTALHYVLISATTGGDGLDSGATTWPTTNTDVIGQVQAACTGAGCIAMVDLGVGKRGTPSSAVSSVNTLTGAVTLFNTNAQTGTYQALAADFSQCKTVQVASGTFNLTLVASGTQPPDGQCMDVINYGSGVVTIVRSGQNINGGTASYVMQSGSATNPEWAHVVSNGTNYFISGGFTNPMTTAGDVVYGGTTGLPTRTPCATANQVLAGGAPPSCRALVALDLPATPLITPGTAPTLVGPRGYAVCTGTCTVSVPVPVAGYEFCIMNDDNVTTQITLSALGSSAMYENSARTAYGTAGTGTLVVAAAAKNRVCILGRDATHYFTVSNDGGAITVN